jgi:hypothetical protein
MTLVGLSESRLLRLTSTIVSLETMRSPSAPNATSGWLSISAACTRSIALCTSVCAERRITTTLSYDPVSTSVLRSPSSSISTVANTNTTSAMPPAVNTVVSLRAHRLRSV